MPDKTTNPRRMRLAIGLLATALAALTMSATAQKMVGSGHALDANLEVNSGGYNRPANAPGYVHRNRYVAGSSRQLYTVNRAGTMTYNPHNAFASNSRYKATGYAGDYSSQAWHSRVRYQGSGAIYGR